MNGRAGPRQDAPIEHQLPCSLEELYRGITKRMKISRNVTDVSGCRQSVTETLSVDIKPGWKKGTRVTFPKKGARIHINPSTCPGRLFRGWKRAHH